MYTYAQHTYNFSRSHFQCVVQLSADPEPVIFPNKVADKTNVRSCYWCNQITASAAAV